MIELNPMRTDGSLFRMMLTMVIFLGVEIAPGSRCFSADPVRIVFPDDECVIDVRKHFGAKGDGKTDDTAALQAALDAGSGSDVRQHKIVYLPNGTYRIRRTLVVNREKAGSGLGPWLYGESRDGVVIRLDDGVQGAKSVLRTHPKKEGKTSANWFMRTVRNLTIDAGDNPETDGIRWYATNTGLLKDVRVVGNGPTGVNSAFLGHNGPNLVQDVEVEGFATGVLSHWIYGQTLSRVTIRNCRETGVSVLANAVGIEDLVVSGTPTALSVEQPDKAHWWSGVVGLVGGDFKGDRGRGTAIVNNGKLYLRDVRTSGFETVLRNATTDVTAEGPSIDEFSSHPVLTLHEETPTTSLRLPIKPEPREWETDPKKWLCANDFGITAGDMKDDSTAFQKAFDEAAHRGATTVYFRGVQSRPRNWYNLENEVRVHGSVRHVIGLGFGRILGNGDDGGFVVDDDSAPLVAFRHIDSMGGTPVTITNRSANRTLHVESCGVLIEGDGGGDIFITNAPTRLRLRQAGQSCWARSLNIEGTDPDGLAVNNGGNLWVMGTKSEGKSYRFITRNGGATEVFGAYEYATHPVEKDDRRPMFWSEDGNLFAAGVFEVCFTGKPYIVKTPGHPQRNRQRTGPSPHWKREVNLAHLQHAAKRPHIASNRFARVMPG